LPPTAPNVGGKLPLNKAICPEKLSASKQAAWEAGLHGSIQQKKVKGNYYFYVRWRDPINGKKRSTYLGKEWDQAIAKLQKLTNFESV
jgi:hypothetical protein